MSLPVPPAPLRALLAAALLLLPALPAGAQDIPGQPPPDAPPMEAPSAEAPAAEAPAASSLPAGPRGIASLLDDRALLDRIELRLSGLTPPPPGSTYRVWLRSEDLTLAQPAGDLPVDDTGSALFAWSQPAGEALFIAFSQVLVTLESSPLAAEPGPIVMGGTVDPGALTHFRRLLARWPDSRYGTASLQGLRQIAAATQLHAAILREAAVHGDLDGMRRKTEHLVNLVEGSHGASFGDLNGDGRAEDPGDGVGLLPYIWGALTQTQFAWATAASEQVAESALAVQPPLRYALAWAGFVRDAGVELTQTQDPARAADLSRHLFTAVQRIVAAVDPGQDESLRGVIAQQEFTPAYESALGLIQVPLFPIANTVTTGTTGSAG